MRGDQAPFRNKKQQSSTGESRIRYKFTKWPSRELFLACKKIKIKCSSLFRKSTQKYLQDVKMTLSKYCWIQSNRL